MAPWKIFIVGSLLLILVSAGGLLLSHYKHRLNSEGQIVTRGASLLVVSLWLASLSILAYIAFAFGKR